MRITELINTYERRLHNTINLVASENLTSPAVRRALACDLNHRYVIPPEGQRPAGIWDYPNQGIIRDIVNETERIACSLYHADAADVRPLSGNQIAQIMLNHLSHNGQRNVWAVPTDCGGHFTTRVFSAYRGFKIRDIPYNIEEGIIDVNHLCELAQNDSPPALFLDASMVLFPHPVRELRSGLGTESVISYDASHTLGLIAGGCFQAPLLEGANYLHGSTHKSLWGPQKGLILSRESNASWSNLYDSVLPLHVSNVHAHHIAALGVALEECELFGNRYAKETIRNAQTLGECLYESGHDVLFPKKGFTQTHQIIISVNEEKAKAVEVWRQLEAAGIHCNAISVPFHQTFGLRIGTSEVTRRGMGIEEMKILAHLISACANSEEDASALQRKVRELSESFKDLLFV